jgi:hypothetical protein
MEKPVHCAVTIPHLDAACKARRAGAQRLRRFIVRKSAGKSFRLCPLENSRATTPEEKQAQLCVNAQDPFSFSSHIRQRGEMLPGKYAGGFALMILAANCQLNLPSAIVTAS